MPVHQTPRTRRQQAACPRDHAEIADVASGRRWRGMFVPAGLRSPPSSELLQELLRLHLATVPPQSPQSPPPLPASLVSVLDSLREAENETLVSHPKEPPDPTLGSLYDKAATDGELLTDGVVTLLAAMKPPPDAVFADLGSGRGGLCFRIAAAVSMRHCFGVELVPSKHAAAEATLHKLGGSARLQTPVSLLEGDFIDIASFKADAEEAAAASESAGAEAAAASFSELTHVYCCSICFDDFLLRRVAQALADRAAFPRFQCLVSQRSLPSTPHLAKIGTLPLECSWATSTAHVYVPADLLDRPAANRRGCEEMLAHFLCDGGACALPAALQWPRARDGEEFGGAFVRMPGAE